ncbi:MAG: DUF4159 domain-containing protein [Gemmataceae bacterium]|nr:DUF4159 domain-containing protein [Gemmataceae bacterium]
MTRMLFLSLVALTACCALSAQEPPARDRTQNFDNQAPRFVQKGPQRGAVIHEPFTPPITAAKIRTAIDDAVYYLRTQQGADGSVGGDEGSTSLTALTLLAAGADPAADDGLKKMLDWLGKRKPNNTYIRGVRANVWEYALRKLPDDPKLKALLKEDFEWLMAAKGDRQGWRYTMQSRDWDNSCTQYGVLGVWAATRAGHDPGDKFWTSLSKHFRDTQGQDGGWSYTTGGSTPNMATAGLASLFLVFDMYHGKTPYSRANPRTFTEGDAAAVLKSLERGMDWLGKQKGGKADGYYLYGIERTGVASGLRLIGGEDWFAEGALVTLQAQQRDGSIPLGQWGRGAIGTSFCTLFLVYGGAPVAVNKLQYGKGSDWNLNPRDLANLSKALWTAYERPINWQTVSITSPAAEFDAPILFLSGSEKWEYTAAEAMKLREYVERGGTILAEPSDHSKPFAESMARLLRDMYPPKDYPNVKLEALAADHPIFTVVKHEWKNRPKLRGASNGSRTFFLLSDEYLSGDWQGNREGSDAFPFAMNLLFYATDLGDLEGKFSTILPEKAAAKAKAGTLTIARVRHGGTRDWEAAGRAWDKLAPLGKHLTGRTFKQADPVVLGKDALKDVKLLHLTGRSTVALTEAEQTALKEFVQGGGTVLVDAHAGRAEFARTARKQLEDLFGELAPLAKEPILAEGRFENGQDLNVGVGFTLAARQAIRARGEKSEGQKILVGLVKGRPAVLFSEYDVVAAGAGIANYRALAYKPESARKILGNVFTYITLD